MIRILLDIDGVCANFTKECLDLIEKHTGHRHHQDEITDYDIFRALKREELRHLLSDAAVQAGFCAGIEPLHGAAAVVEELKSLGEVVVVTSPMDTPHWTYERTEWIARHLGIPREQIVFAKSKHYIGGSFLIDDHADNCNAWHIANRRWAGGPEPRAILIDAPWNRLARDGYGWRMTFAETPNFIREKTRDG